MKPSDFEQVEVKSVAELWDWMDQNFARSDSVVLITWKRTHRDRYVSREDVLDALIAYGWVDGRRWKLDADRTMQMISPRQQQAWAKTYQDRADRLNREGRIKPSGISAIKAAKESGKWDDMSHVDALIEPEALIASLTEAGALDWWRSAAPSYRRNVLRWVATGKNAVTRQMRIDIIAAHAARGEKVPQY